jgi:ADP-heptose:LPS heptosyltransferase
VLVMTAAVESLMQQYPGKFSVDVQTSCPDIWLNNPHITPNLDNAKMIEMHYPNINESHMIRTGHFMKGFCDYLGDRLELPLKLKVNRPYIYLTEEEKKEKRIVDGRYIVINAGVKSDYTCKAWGQSNYQEVTHALKDKFKIVQVGEIQHMHKPLEGAVNMIGKTSLRQFLKLCYHADAAIGGVTLLQHIMAAFEKPYVSLMGGREPLSWEWYPTQVTLSTQGQLKCCSPNACWKSRVVPLSDGDSKNKSLCELPVIKNGEYIPKCMEMIRPSEVVRAIERYIDGGVIKI